MKLNTPFSDLLPPLSTEKKKAVAKKEQVKKAKSIKTDCGIIHGDFRKQDVDDNSIGLIFTDPPYDKDAAALYQDLTTFAARVLVPGGWLLAYSGQAHLPEVYQSFANTPGLQYSWTFCCLHSGGDLRFRKYKLQNGWKPIVAAYKPPLSITWEWFKDIVSGGKEKDSHEWQQAESEAAYFIERLTVSQSIVCDPFAGSGTSLAAARSLGRQWLGFDIDNEAVVKARIRLS